MILLTRRVESNKDLLGLDEEIRIFEWKHEIIINLIKRSLQLKDVERHRER